MGQDQGESTTRFQTDLILRDPNEVMALSVLPIGLDVIHFLPVLETGRVFILADSHAPRHEEQRTNQNKTQTELHDKTS
jgi:hypothetical protein